MSNNINPWQAIVVYALVIIMALLIAMPTRCSAQTATIDTVNCKIECITEVVFMTSESGKTRMYAVYKDRSTNVEEIIPISKTVVDYMEMCRKHSIKPSLGIRLRNGIITSIIRIKPKYRKKNG